MEQRYQAVLAVIRDGVPIVEVARRFDVSGQSVTVSAVAANRDSERFADPDKLDIHRDARGHDGFGHGLHSCVGQQLGRLEIRTALAALMRRFPDLRLEHADQSEPTEFYHPVPVYPVGRVIVAWD